MKVECVTNFINDVREEYNQFLNKISLEDLEVAANLIQTVKMNGGRVHITGIGKPSYVARYISSLLSSTGTQSYFLDGTEAVHGSSGQVANGDTVIVISNSGQTAELHGTVETLKKNGASIIGVSGNTHSWLKEQSDVFLFAGVSKEGDVLNKPPRLSILAEMTVLQCLSILLEEDSGLTMEEYYSWHPGGSLGASIRQEIME